MFNEIIFFVTRNFFSIGFQNIRNDKASAKGKETIGDSPSTLASSRCNSKYFGDIVRELDESKKKIIRDHGFGILLEYDGAMH